MAVISVAQAAAELQVSSVRVRDLIRRGHLAADRVGGQYLLDDRDVARLDTYMRHGGVRSFSQRVAWATAALADGESTDLLTASERSRLLKRMDGASSDVGSWIARMRSRAERSLRLRIAEERLADFVRDTHVLRTGATATNLVSDSLVARGQAEVWIRNGHELEGLRTEFGLLRSDKGNVTCHVAELDTTLGRGGNAFRLIVAMDLVNADDSRSRRAGEELLDTVLTERRWRT